jgi:hypothetical protein
MTPPPSLRDLMEGLRQRGGDWSTAQEPGADRATVTRAWLASDDAFAMLLLLAALHPDRNVPVCDALVANMSFFSPMREEGERQARCRPGMNYNGPSRFQFLHLAQRLRNALFEMDEPDRAAVEPRLSAALRVVVVDPYVVGRETQLLSVEPPS